MSLENGKCPCCNGALTLDSSKEKAVCRYCGHEIVIQQAVQKCIVDGIATFDTILLAAQQAIDYDRDYDLALKKYKEALNLQPNDYRVLWGMFLCEIEALKWYQATKGYVQYEGDLPQNVEEKINRYGEKAKSLAPADVQPYYFQVISETRNYFSQKQPKAKQGCYVATCVYGSYNCPEVWTLRRYRDNVLGQTWYGRAFIRTYYAISPLVVKVFGKFNWFRNIFKKKLDRMVESLNCNGVDNTPYNDKSW